MCDTCGCGEPGNKVRITRLNEDGTHEHHYEHEHEHEHGGEKHEHPHEHSYIHSHEHGAGADHSHDDGAMHDHGHAHEHDHDHSHGHSHEHGHEHDHEHGDGTVTRRIDLEVDIMARNNMLAERNRGFFEGRNILALNWVSSPGSGKTTILEKTIAGMKDSYSFCIIEGDQQSLLDAERISKTGVPVVQVNTGSGCHLDASMVNQAVKTLDPPAYSAVMIENVGNLVCPALFDLGEQFRIVVVSLTEGEDKPLKYPDMFRTSQLCIINKMDLAPHLDADVALLRKYALQVNPDLEIFELSARTGDGMETWFSWLQDRMKPQNSL